MYWNDHPSPWECCALFRKPIRMFVAYHYQEPWQSVKTVLSSWLWMEGVKTLSITKPSTQSMGLQHSRLTNFYNVCTRPIKIKYFFWLKQQRYHLSIPRTTHTVNISVDVHSSSRYCPHLQPHVYSTGQLLLRKDGRVRMRNMGYIPWGVAK